MPSFEEHCRETAEKYLKPFEHVHLWLDEFAGKPPYGMKHRRVRHHQAGVNEVHRLFGADAAHVAKEHILADLRMEGWTEGDPFPLNEAHYVALGLF